jgi:uncharacterized membrane protein (DUF441 family)
MAHRLVLALLASALVALLAGTAVTWLAAQPVYCQWAGAC